MADSILAPILGALIPVIGFALALTVISLEASAKGAEPYEAFMWHPIFMTLGFGLFMTTGVVSYVLPFNFLGMERKYRRALHGVMQMMALGCIAVGLAAIMMDNYTGEKIPKWDGLEAGSQVYGAHVIIGFSVSILSFLLALVGVARMGLKAANVDENRFIPAAFVHGILGQFVWVAGMVNICLGAYFGLDKMAQAGGVMALAILIVILAAVLKYAVDHGVRKTDDSERADRDSSNPLIAGDI